MARETNSNSRAPSFSERTDHDSEENALSRALSAKRARGPVLDLSLANPTIATLPYPANFGEPASGSDEAARAMRYEPAAFGLREAREAIACEYADDRARVSPDDVILTASTSEAYAHLFTTLCDPGDEVIILTPCYPLFAYLARFASVTLVPVALAYDGAWHIDVDAIRSHVCPRTRAIIIVSPNNPTGSFLKRGELDALLDLEVPLVVDEVFAPYAFGADATRVTSVAGETRGLLFSLSGLSKRVGLPQAKLAWIAIAGERARVAEARRRLELVLDTFLNVSSLVQHRAPRLLSEGRVTRDAIRARTIANLRTAKATFVGAANPLHVEGGWYVTLRLPRTKPEETWAIELLEEHAIYTHPGAFFDFSEEAYLILSLLVPEADFTRGAITIAKHVG